MSQNNYQENQKEVQQEIARQLKNKKNVLLQSNPGMGVSSITKLAAAEAGLTLVEFISDYVPSPFKYEQGALVPVFNSTQQIILDELKSNNANAILLSLVDENIEDFVSAAKAANIPLIVIKSHNREFEPTVSASFFDDAKEMQDMIKEIAKLKGEELKEAAIVSKITALRAVSYVVAEDRNNKPK